MHDQSSLSAREIECNARLGCEKHNKDDIQNVTRKMQYYGMR